jgi:hypothetical protein
MRWSFAILVVVLCAALPKLARADRLTVAVVPGIAVNIEAARVDTLSQQLADALRAELDIEVIGGLEVRRKLPDAGLPPDCIAQQACIDSVAKALGAQQLLFVVMVDTGTGGAVQVDTTWVDVISRKTASRPAIDIATVATAQGQFAEAARQLLPDAPVRPKLGTSLGKMSDPIPRHLGTPTYISGGVSAAGFVVGLSFGLVARSRYRSCESSANHGIGCTQSRKDSIRSLDLAADAGWFVGLGGAVATAVLYSLSGEQSHIIVEPVPGGATVSASGRF